MGMRARMRMSREMKNKMMDSTVFRREDNIHLPGTCVFVFLARVRGTG